MEAMNWLFSAAFILCVCNVILLSKKFPVKIMKKKEFLIKVSVKRLKHSLYFFFLQHTPGKHIYLMLTVIVVIWKQRIMMRIHYWSKWKIEIKEQRKD